MKMLRDRILVGRRIKLQAALFTVIAVCLIIFFYGMFTYTDAPYKPCLEGKYCGKMGEPYPVEVYEGWKRWETLLFICWPFGMVASYGLSRLRKPPPLPQV